MKFQALYRKYRPKNFNEVVGQKVTLQILKNAIINNHISHAYLFYGPRGTGKTSIAKIFSRTINCDNTKDGIPCEECDNCITSKNAGCVDIIEIDAASNNGVDEIRELKNKISFVPSELRYKVYIIDEVHMLSTGAFNALLKTLEEPPEHAIFILATTELNKIPLTIISRCQTLEFRKIDDNSMFEKLSEISSKEKIEIDESGIKEIIKNSNGGLRDAIGLLEKAVSYTDSLITNNIIKEISGNVSDSELQNFIDLYNSENTELVLDEINKLYNEGIDLIKFSNNIIDYLRNKMISEKKYDKEICDFIIELDEAVSKMEKSENQKILFEVTIINNLIRRKDNSAKVTSDNGKNNIINESDTKTKDSKENVEKEKVEDDKSKNAIEELKEIRVGNTLCNPQKNLILNIRTNWQKIDDLAFDTEFGNIARMLSSDIKPVAASETNLILESKLAGLSMQLNNDLITVEKIISKTFNQNFKVICLHENEWKQYTLEYKNNKDRFKYKEEITKDNKENKSLKEKAKDLFDD